MQQHVAVAQQDAVMMMVRVAYFPQHFAIPVGFQDDAAFEREAAQKALLRRAPVVKQCPAFCEIAGQAGRVRHVPGVDDLALQVDEINVPALHEVRSKQRKSRKGALWLARAQPDAPSFEGVLLDRGHERATSNDGARSERSKASEQRASLQKPRFMVDHWVACNDSVGLNILADVIQPILWRAQSARAAVVRHAAS